MIPAGSKILAYAVHIARPVKLDYSRSNDMDVTKWGRGETKGLRVVLGNSTSIIKVGENKKPFFASIVRDSDC